MRKLEIILGCIMAINVLAAPGDSFNILGDNVNVRKGPSLKNPMVIKLQKGHGVVEMQRQDGWVEIVDGKTGEKLGWVHSSLIGQKKTEGPAIVTTKDKFQKFMSAFDGLNTNIKNKMGLVYFTKAEELGDGIIQITATDEWVNMPKTEKENTLRIIFKIWDKTEGSGLPIAVYIVDKNNNHHMSLYR